MINKNWAFALGIVSLSTAMVAADQAQQMDKNPPMPMGVTSQPTGVITPPVAPVVSNGADVFVTGDFIYWNSYQEGLGYAISGQNQATNVGKNNNIARGTVAEADSDFQPGFKVGLGLMFEHDGWDLFAQYTWLNPSTDSDSISDTANNDLLATLGREAYGTALADTLSYASASHRLSYNVVDLEMGRNFFVSRYLTLRPHFGLKSAWLTQKFNTHYAASSSFTGLSQFSSSTDDYISQNQRSWGIGIRAGLDPVWHFTRCWGMYGNLALSAMYSYTKDRLSETFYDATGANYLKTQSVRNSRHDVAPVLELGLGLTYMTWFYDETYMLDVKAGWEEQVWFNNNHFIATDKSTGKGGNLSLQGFTFKLGFHF